MRINSLRRKDLTESGHCSATDDEVAFSGPDAKLCRALALADGRLSVNDIVYRRGDVGDDLTVGLDGGFARGHIF